MPVDENYKQFIIEQLSEFGEFTSKNMFGGVGFFRDKAMFAGIMGGIFRLKADESTIPDFLAFGKGPWQHGSGSMAYYEVPEEILNDKTALREWALKAYEIALRAKMKKGKKK